MKAHWHDRAADWLRTLSPVALSAGAASLVMILWRGGWPEGTAEARVQWLGLGLLAVIGLLGLALFLTRGGLTSLSIKAGPVEASLGTKGDDDGSNEQAAG